MCTLPVSHVKVHRSRVPHVKLAKHRSMWSLAKCQISIDFLVNAVCDKTLAVPSTLHALNGASAQFDYPWKRHGRFRHF